MAAKIDNFTVGFLSIEYLKYFALDTLKIDRSLVQKLTDSPQDLAIATAIIRLGQGFNLRVVAEGVETQEQVDILQALNCQYVQGYWFGRPLAAEEASKLLPFDSLETTRELVESQTLESIVSEQTLEKITENIKLESAEISED